MRHSLVGQTLDIYPPFRTPGAIIEDWECIKCNFDGCHILCDDPWHRPIVRNIDIRQSRAHVCQLFGAIFEDIHINTLHVIGELRLGGVALRHVTLSGLITRLFISDLFKPACGVTAEDLAREKQFAAANQKYYQSVDWALDISKAEFCDEADIRGVPARLIRRDPETQAVVTRAKALRGGWQSLPLQNTYWSHTIDMMLRHDWDGAVLVAPKRSKKTFKPLMEGIRILREAGVAEAD